MKKEKFGFLLLAFCLIPSLVFALNEIQIEQVAVQNQSADRYEVSAIIQNQTTDPREVTVRAQIFFFEKASPKGQKPAMILRKDETMVLNPSESRQVIVRLLNEGTFPKERLRIEPEVRVRRQRIWNY